MDIEIQELHHSYPGGVEALRGVSLRVASGERLAIVGQNGAGKTTLVKHINGLLKPTSGRVLVGGWDTREHAVGELAARAGYVFQDPDIQLFSSTVHDELEFGPRNVGCSPEDLERNVAFALKVTGLEKYRSTNPYDLSSSWRKLIAVASVVAMDTEILILDEPTTGQDAVNIAKFVAIIDELSSRGKTILAITHDIDFAAEHFDRLVAMAMGTVLLDGATKDVIGETEILAKTYVEPPQLTRLGNELGLREPVSDEVEFLDAVSTARGVAVER